MTVSRIDFVTKARNWIKIKLEYRFSEFDESSNIISIIQGLFNIETKYLAPELQMKIMIFKVATLTRNITVIVENSWFLLNSIFTISLDSLVS